MWQEWRSISLVKYDLIRYNNCRITIADSASHNPLPQKKLLARENHKVKTKLTELFFAMLERLFFSFLAEGGPN